MMPLYMSMFEFKIIDCMMQIYKEYVNTLDDISCALWNSICVNGIILIEKTMERNV